MEIRWMLFGALSVAWAVGPSRAICPHAQEVEEMRGRKGGFVKRCLPKQGFFVWEVVACLLPSGRRLEFGRRYSEGRYFFTCRKSGEIGGRLHADEIPPPNAANNFVYFTQGWPPPHRHVTPAADVLRTWYPDPTITTTPTPSTTTPTTTTTSTTSTTSTTARTTPTTTTTTTETPTTAESYDVGVVDWAGSGRSAKRAMPDFAKLNPDVQKFLDRENRLVESRKDFTMPTRPPVTPPPDAVLFATTKLPFHQRYQLYRAKYTTPKSWVVRSVEESWHAKPQPEVRMPGCWLGLRTVKGPYELECYVDEAGEKAYRIGACLVAELGDRRLVVGQAHKEERWTWKCQLGKDGKVSLNLEMLSED